MGLGEQENVQKHLDFLEESQRKSEEAERRAASLQKELESAELESKKGSYFAPFDGVILKRYKNEGEVCAIGERVFSLCDLDRLWVEAEVVEAEIHKIAVGTPAVVRINAYPNKKFTGKVCYIGSATAAKSDHLPWSDRGETIPIKIALETKDPILKPGLSAKVDLKVH
jgi:multidrug resistance efflux pump